MFVKCPCCSSPESHCVMFFNSQYISRRRHSMLRQASQQAAAILPRVKLILRRRTIRCLVPSAGCHGDCWLPWCFVFQVRAELDSHVVSELDASYLQKLLNSVDSKMMRLSTDDIQRAIERVKYISPDDNTVFEVDVDDFLHTLAKSISVVRSIHRTKSSRVYSCQIQQEMQRLLRCNPSLQYVNPSW